MTVLDTLAMQANCSPVWMKSAACQYVDPEIFYPDNPSSCTPETRQALRICKDCLVREACLQWAMEEGDRHAILGGKTPRQRALLRAQLLSQKAAS